MELTDTILTMFSGEVEECEGTPVVTLPDRELDLGALAVGETYRVAILERPPADATMGASTTNQHGSQPASTPPVEKGELHEVEIEDVGEQGDGIARIGPGYIVFVPDTAVGDRVTIEITEVRENVGFAKVTKEEPLSG